MTWVTKWSFIQIKNPVLLKVKRENIICNLKFPWASSINLFQNGFHFHIVLSAIKYALLASFKANVRRNILLTFEFDNEVRMANLNTKKEY